MADRNHEIESIRMGTVSGEVIDSKSHLTDTDWYAMLDTCNQYDDPIEGVAMELWETKEIPYITWIEVNGVRKDAPFEYPGIPRWWEPGYARRTAQDDDPEMIRFNEAYPVD